MKLAMIGLGRMGANMGRRLARNNHQILALQMRFRSRQKETYSEKVLNAMRAGFGGHAIKPAEDKQPYGRS